jgi:glycosyltransferase involved in cell wall biosynthesis
MEFSVKQPLISCLVPVYNGELYLREAIDSILAQTYRPLEIIVVDDGSTDATPDVVAGYGDQLRYVRQANAGPGAARNHGLSLARGEYVAFLDADDLWHPEKLARQMTRFRARPQLDLCVTHIQNFWIPALHEEEARFRNHRIMRALPGYTPVTLLARRQVFNQVGPFNATFRHIHDTEWFVRLAESGGVTELLSDTLVYRRLHYTNRSRRLAAASRDEYLQLVKISIDRQRRLSGMS